MEEIIVPIHFKNPPNFHEIDSESLLVFIESYKRISTFLGMTLDIQISVPEEGGWKAYLKIAVKGMVQTIGLGFFMALLTGKTHEDWGTLAHDAIVYKINAFLTTKAKELPNNIPKECLRNKNNIYKQFEKDDRIEGFKLGSMTIIPKADFGLYIEDIPEDEVVNLGQTEIIVHSPDWQGKRSWRGQIAAPEYKECNFTFNKKSTAAFWEKIKSDNLQLHTSDKMIVQLIKRPKAKVKYLVIRVLEYNGAYIDAPLNDAEIQKIVSFNNEIGVDDVMDEDAEQMVLFDDED